MSSLPACQKSRCRRSTSRKARRRVGETKRRLSFASASTPARVISTRPKRLEDQHIPRPPRPKSTCFAGAESDADAGGGGAAASAAGLVDKLLLLHRVDCYSTAVGEAGGGTGCLTMAYTFSASLQRGAKTHYSEKRCTPGTTHRLASSCRRPLSAINNNDLRAGIDMMAAEGLLFRNCHA